MKGATTMTNTALLNHMIEKYNALAYTHEYIFGFSYKENIYQAFVSSSFLSSILTLDRASRGAGCSLRFCPTNDIKVALLPYSEVLCSEKFFNEQVEASIYNKGEIFEKLVTESFGQIWKKDNVPFTDGGDIEVDGTAYQIKFQKATFTNEKALMRAGA